METNSINITWNNTDRSVSYIKIKTTSPNQRIESMNTQDTSHTRSNRFPPRHIAIEEGHSHRPATAGVEPGLDELLASANREAASLAWSTGYPFLVLPCLEEELENNAREYWSRQTRIQKESLRLLHQTFPVRSRLLAA